MYCMKTKRQVNYLPSNDNNTSLKKAENFDQIDLWLAIHQYTQNKNLLYLFSSQELGMKLLKRLIKIMVFSS